MPILKRIASHRLTRLGGILLLHIAVFLAIARWVIFSTPSEVVPEVLPVPLVKIVPAALPAPSPPPQSSPSMSLPDMASTRGVDADPRVSTAPTFAPVRTPDTQNVLRQVVAHDTDAMSHLPTNTIEAEHISDDAAGRGDFGMKGQGTGAGNGEGMTLGGLTIPGTEKTAFVVDVSESVIDGCPLVPEIFAGAQKTFHTSFVIFSKGARGTFMTPSPDSDSSGAKAVYQLDDESDATGRFVHLAFQLKVNADAVTDDLYSGAYLGAKKGMTSIVLLTDFEDGYDPDATKALVTYLRAKHIHLYVISIEERPYPGLLEYAQESNGGGIITTKKLDPFDANNAAGIITITPSDPMPNLDQLKLARKIRN